MKKRNMSLILVLALILCLIPATAFADNEKTLSGDISTLTEITENTTTNGNVTIKTGGSIVVKNNATLTIDVNNTISVYTGGSIVVEDGSTLVVNHTLDLAQADGTARVLKINDGGTLVVNRALFSKNNFADVEQLGTMEVKGSNANVIMYAYGSNQTTYIGNDGLITLDSNAVITSTPLVENSYEGGYKYVISSSSATETATAKTKNFPNSGKDELVVADGATLDASAGMTLNGTSTKQLTVQNGGKLILPTDTDKAKALLSAAYGGNNQKIKSGTYTVNPATVDTTSYVATGYDVTKASDKDEWTVTPKGYLSKIAVAVKEPVVGETPASTFTSTVKEDGSATPADEDGLSVAWFKIAKADYVAFSRDTFDDWTMVADKGEKFQKDYYYACLVSFDVTDGYEISDNFVATVNGKKADLVVSSYGYVTIAKEFGPLAEKSPVTGDNNELGLFAVAGLISALGVALMLRRKHSM